MGVARLYATIKHLKPRQIAYQLLYRATDRLTKRGLGLSPKPDPSLSLNTSETTSRILRAGRVSPSYSPAGARFTFLNREKGFGRIEAIDWDFAEFGKLWTYHLNYFEFLRSPGMIADEGLALIHDWIGKSPGLADAWEPYPISLRLVHWFQFLRTHRLEPDAAVADSLLAQYSALWTKVEYHLDGNHLLENAIALKLTATYLGSPNDARRADSLLLEQLAAQYLHDGAHYESSVMYHLVLLHRQLDLLSVLTDDDRVRGPLLDSVKGQFGWLSYILGEGDRFPHFNDATDGVAPAYSVVRAFGAALGVSVDPPAPARLSLPRYVHWSGPGYDLWIDAAPIGPDHIPGHAHADSHGFELNVRGLRWLVDTGTSTYEKNAQRQFERSTAAHNTVGVDDKDSSDVWSGFRVGERARVQILAESSDEISLAHDGYRGMGITHVRSFRREASPARFKIIDVLTGAQRDRRCSAFWHFDHGTAVEISDRSVSTTLGTIRFDGATSLSVANYQQALGFNRIVLSKVVTVQFETRLTTVITPKL